MKNIEIIGTQFVNKGAELMTLAILEKFNKHNKKVRFCMEPSNNSPYEKRAKLGLYQKVNYFYKRMNLRFLGSLIPEIIRKKYGIILDQEIDIFLDASGFLYSEQWGKRSAKKLARSIVLWKKQGSKIILLPQAFGPFESTILINDMKTVVQHADLIFARDEVSYKHLCSIAGAKKNIKLAPDFTNILSIDNDNIENNKICIIPNARMMDKTTYKNEYLRLLANIIKLLVENNLEYFCLIHEGHEDKKIIDEVQKIYTFEVNIVFETNPLKIKEIIRNSKGVIGSRFHGLINSLSQNKPVIAIGWSHKYEELLKDYGCPDNIIDLKDANMDLVRDRLKIFTSIDIYNDEVKRLSNYSEVLKTKTQKMWTEVFKVIEL